MLSGFVHSISAQRRARSVASRTEKRRSHPSHDERDPTGTAFAARRDTPGRVATGGGVCSDAQRGDRKARKPRQPYTWRSTRGEIPKTRTGKIARLPYKIRAKLNQRLLDGQSGPHLLTWLNDLPEVKQSLAENFGGRAISQENLSTWRTGGFRDWEKSLAPDAWQRRALEHRAEEAQS